jgi:UbiA prenyltransferase family protein
MKKVLSVIRSQEWWGYKIPPLLALGYATALLSDIPLNKVALWLLFLLAAIIVDAIYVSIINDITDIEEDLASNKKNRMAAISPRVRWIFPAVCMVIGLYFICFVFTDRLSVVLYVLSWLSFTLYSFPPVRLKKRGILGVFADACGSTFFPALLMVSATSAYIGHNADWLWFSAVGVWALANGLRGILWHQFHDRENDLKVNLNTFASKVDPKSFKPATITIMLVELIALAYMLARLATLLPVVFLVMYLLLVMMYRKMGYRITVIMSPKDGAYQILMSDYYQVLFPLSLLIAATMIYPAAWIVLVVHVFLFHAKILLIGKDILRFLKG